jgi:hypothetical protein
MLPIPRILSKNHSASVPSAVQTQETRHPWQKMTNDKFSMTISQFSPGVLVLACLLAVQFQKSRHFWQNSVPQ